MLRRRDQAAHRVLDDAAGTQALASLTNLTTLSIGDNNFGDASARSLSALTNLTTLNIRKNDLGDAAQANLGQQLNRTRIAF